VNGVFFIGTTGLAAQQRALDVIANNIANINTTAFKRSEVRFAELVVQRSDSKQVDAAFQPEVLSGVVTRSPVRVFEQGDLRQTGQPYDLAVTGDGFLSLLGPGGQTYLWRGGTLKVNAEGYLTTENGLVLKALIQVPEDSTALSIGLDGKVLSTSSGIGGSVEIGNLTLARAEDASLLQAVGGGLFAVDSEDAVSEFAPGESGMGVFNQGALEGANVDLSQEMVTLLVLQRAYAANAQTVQAGDQLMAIANGLRR
jgi:flagellar basal-body rod protein FlgG